MKIIMQLAAVLLFTVLGVTKVTAQEIKISYDSTGVHLNNKLITATTPFDEVKAVLGKKYRKQKYTKQAVAYVYKKNGLIFLTEDGNIKGITITLIPDTVDGGPKEVYEGAFAVNGVSFSKSSTQADILALTTVDLECPGPGFCSISMDSTESNCMFGFSSTGKLFTITLSTTKNMLH